MILCCLFAFAGCNNETGNSGGNNGGNNGNTDTGTYYTVTFDSMGGSNVESQRIREGNPARAPEVPTRETYSFIGWYKTAEENAALWDFSTDRVTSDATLYAKWESNTVEETPTESLTFERNGNGYTVTGASGQEERIIIPAEYNGLPVTGIGERAFSYSNHTSDITYVSIPDTVTSIELNAFYSRSELVTVVIGENSNLTTIGRNAFSGNGSLKSMYIPQGVDSIGESAFNNCGSLESITVASENTTYRSENGHLIERATNTLIRGANNNTVPDGIKVIAQAAFRRANMITELNIPKSVENIGNYFVADSAITKINYAGTESEWNAIEKSSTMWNYGNRDVTVVYSATGTETPDEQKILIAYFSATNNTEAIANHIHTYLNADMYEILAADPYTEDDLKYYTNGRADLEQRDPTCRPEINGSVENIAQYDVIFIGYPIWHGIAPRILYTFMESYDFNGITIIPFCTSASSGMGSSATELERLTTGATWLDGQRFSRSASYETVTSWIDGLNY